MNTTSAIKIFGDKFIVRKTFDILDYVGDFCGFEISDENGNFLFQIDGEDEKLVESEIKWRVYRSIL